MQTVRSRAPCSMFPPPQRYALLIGAMKAGTTALYQALARHPEIAACAEKEPAWWIQEARRARGIEGYAALWKDTLRPQTRWCLEASTAYTKLPVRPSPAPWLRRAPATFRFVYVVRNPIERIRSHYRHSLAEGWMDEPIGAGIDPQVVWTSNYRMQLWPYVDCFGRDAILVLSYEELRSQPASVLARVCRFLDLEPTLPLQLPKANDSGAYRTRRLVHLLGRAGALVPEDAEALAALPFEPLVRSLCGDARSRPLVERTLEAMEREVTPDALLTEEIHAALDEDLERFAEEWGLDPWTGRRLRPQLA